MFKPTGYQCPYPLVGENRILVTCLSGTQDTKLQALLGLLLYLRSLTSQTPSAPTLQLCPFSPSAACLASCWFLTAMWLLQHSGLFTNHRTPLTAHTITPQFLAMFFSVSMAPSKRKNPIRMNFFLKKTTTKNHKTKHTPPQKQLSESNTAIDDSLFLNSCKSHE